MSKIEITTRRATKTIITHKLILADLFKSKVEIIALSLVHLPTIFLFIYLLILLFSVLLLLVSCRPEDDIRHWSKFPSFTPLLVRMKRMFCNFVYYLFFCILFLITLFLFLEPDRGWRWKIPWFKQLSLYLYGTTVFSLSLLVDSSFINYLWNLIFPTYAV